MKGKLNNLRRSREDSVMISTYFFIKRNRFKKKWKLYKQLFLLSFDWTSLFYGLLILAYLIVAIYFEGIHTSQWMENIAHLESLAIQAVWYIVTIIPLTRIIRAFQSPGVMFSSA